MSAIKFTFDDDFEGSSSGSIRRNKLEDERAAAYAEGQEAGRAEVLESLDHNCEALLHNILTAAQNLLNRQDEQVSLMNKEAAKLAHAITEKLAPALVEQTPLEEIELLVNQCLKNSPLEPHLAIRVDETILPFLQERLDKMKKDSGYQGQLIIIGEPMGHISDCRVEWANGGVERDFNNLNNTIESTIKLFIEASDTPSNGQTGEIDSQTGVISETVTGE